VRKLLLLAIFFIVGFWTGAAYGANTTLPDAVILHSSDV
jgi:hypothetical protein